MHYFTPEPATNTSVKSKYEFRELLVAKTTKFQWVEKVENIGEKLEVVLVQEAWFVAVAVRRSSLSFLCSCPASMNAPGCQLFEFRARKMRYDPSRAILPRAPLNLWIAFTPQRFEMVSIFVAFRLSTVPLVPSSKGMFDTTQPLSSMSNASWAYLADFLS